MIAINFDRLEVSLKQTAATDCMFEWYEEGREMKKGDYLFYNPRPLSDYKCVWEIYNNRKKCRIGLFFIGFKRFANVDYCRIKYDDSLFYSDFDFAGETFNFCKAVDCEFSGISSLDIALDTDEAVIFPGYKYVNHEITHRSKGHEAEGITLSEFVHAAADGAVIREARFNRSKMTPIAEFCGRNGKRYETMYIGERDSSVFARIYNKSKEMHDKGEKTFITSEWRRRGWSDKNPDPVWRFEIGLNNLASNRNKMLINLPEDGFLLLRNALPVVSRKKAPALFFAIMSQFFTFTTRGGKSARKTRFYNELSYNCGYVLSVKPLREKRKQKKDLIKYNTITRYFAKYTRGLMHTPEARAYFDINERIVANTFVQLYERLHDAAKHTHCGKIRSDRRRRYSRRRSICDARFSQKKPLPESLSPMSIT